jgi:hypothetical protein
VNALTRARKRLWIWIVGLVVVLAVTGFALQRSVTIRTSWKVLPYQSLRLSDSENEVETNAFTFPEPTPLDRTRGYIEAEHAVRLHVVSNTSWKIQIRSASANASVMIRKHGDEYFALSAQPKILAQGQNGVFEISVDYRLHANAGGEFDTNHPLEIVYTVMSD